MNSNLDTYGMPAVLRDLLNSNHAAAVILEIPASSPNIDAIRKTCKDIIKTRNYIEANISLSTDPVPLKNLHPEPYTYKAPLAQR